MPSARRARPNGAPVRLAKPPMALCGPRLPTFHLIAAGPLRPVVPCACGLAPPNPLRREARLGLASMNCAPAANNAN
jgi:hypothetical protein